MTRGRILVTPRSMSRPDADGLDTLEAAGYDVVMPAPGRQPTSEELIAALPGAIGWIAGVEPIGPEVLDHADALRAISRNGAGRDGVDASAEERGIAVLTARGANARGVAELALALMVCGLRGIGEASASVRAGGWERSVGREVEGRTLGIVGYGSIGRLLGAFSRSLGMHVIAHDPFLDDADAGVDLVELDDLLTRSEVVSLHVPPSPAGPLLDATRVGLLRSDVVLINTARSTLVDESALLERLTAGDIALYSVDAFDVEPPAPSPLLGHPRVLPTPHLGAATLESSRRAARAAVDNLLGHLNSAEIPRG